jgi:hypothetical protein
MTRDDEKRSPLTLLRFVTPLLVTIALFMVNQLNGSIDKVNTVVHEIDAKLFKHLTNDEMHTPRSLVLFKSEQDLINRIRTEQFNNINYQLSELKLVLLEHEKSQRK